MADQMFHPIGLVESPLTELDAAPRQGDEGAPRVRDLEAVDGTQVLDIEPVLGPIDQR